RTTRARQFKPSECQNPWSAKLRTSEGLLATALERLERAGLVWRAGRRVAAQHRPGNMISRTQRGKVGLFGIGLAAYWPQFKGLKQRLEGYQRVVARRFGEFADVVD